MSPAVRLDLDRDEPTGIIGRGALSTVGVLVQGLVRFVYSVLIGRLLTPALLAATNSAISLALFTSLLWPTATATAATKFVARANASQTPADVHGIARHLALVSAGSALALAVGAGVFSWLVLDPGDLLSALLVGLLVVAWAMYSFVRGLHFAVRQVGRATLWDTISAVLAISLLVVVIWLDATALLLLPLTIGYAVYAIAGIPRGAPRTRLSRELRREMNGFTAWTALGTLASTGLLQLSMVIAGSVGTPDAAGAYAAALTLATPASMVARSLSLVLFPSMASASGRADHASVRRQTDLTTRGLVALMGVIFGVLVVAAQPVVLLVFGARYLDAQPILMVLLAASLLVTINVACVNSLSAATQHGVRVPALLSAVGMVIGLVVMWALSPALDVLGVAFGYLAGAILIGLGPIAYVWRTQRMHWGGLALRAALGTAVAAASVWILAVVDVSPWWALAAAAVFAVVWLLLMLPEVRVINSLRRGRGTAAPVAP